MVEQGTPFSILCLAYLFAVESTNLAVRLDKASHCHQQMVGYGCVNDKRERGRLMFHDGYTPADTIINHCYRARSFCQVACNYIQLNPQHNNYSTLAAELLIDECF